VWAADVTYIPMQQGFLYLVAIIDWQPAGCCAKIGGNRHLISVESGR
jgi:hypothetical protein